MVQIKKSFHTLSVKQKIECLVPLLADIRQASNIEMKMDILNKQPEVAAFLEGPNPIHSFLAGLSSDHELLVKSIIAMGQGPIVFNHIESVKNPFESLHEMLTVLQEVEKFYEDVGGLLGYYLTVLKLISDKGKKSGGSGISEQYSKPPGIDISGGGLEVLQAIKRGVDQLPKMAEIYPVGGAGDRLKLIDRQTGEMLPAAQLCFCGRSLLEGLIRDLQAREYLYYKVHGRQITTPVAMMTSHEKDNHARVVNICTSHHWFGRPENSFRLFVQPLVPVICEQGNWSLRAPLKPTLKPGGHGAIWKLALDEGVFDWLEAHHRKAALLRQINNPIAGVDRGLLAFAGIGCDKGKAFGFASCFRRLQAAEGMIVLIESQNQGSFDYCITNIEYTDFKSKGIQDIPESPGSPYSAYHANTNILFVDIEAVKKTLQKCIIPGMLINLKSTFPYIDPDGVKSELKAGRLESTMQNIADHIIDRFPERLAVPTVDDFRTYVTYNDRRSTISVTKNSYVSGRGLHETPEGCFYDMHLNSKDLLSSCGMAAPDCADEQRYLERGPSFLFQYHPALGPLYSVIAQKIRLGKMEEGSELLVDASEIDFENVHVDGSLQVIAENVMGHKDQEGIVCYSSLTGKCELHNVRVVNRGVDWEAENTFWENRIQRHESLRIILQGSAEFCARGLVFEGGREIVVPNGHRMEAIFRNGRIEMHLKKIDKPTWKWTYRFDKECRLSLEKEME